MKKTTLSKSKKKKVLERKNKILMRLLVSLLVLFIVVLIGVFVSSFDNSNDSIDYVSSVDSTALHSEKDSINAQLTAKNMNYRNNWYNYITPHNNDFSYYEIGGIEDLKVSVKNDTEYVLNEVVVDVCYVIDNGSCYKNEEVALFNVPPNSFLVVDAPSSNRGKKVILTIKKIYSDKMNFLYSSSYSSGNQNDLFFYKG